MLRIDEPQGAYLLRSTHTVTGLSRRTLNSEEFSHTEFGLTISRRLDHDYYPATLLDIFKLHFGWEATQGTRYRIPILIEKSSSLQE